MADRAASPFHPKEPEKRGHIWPQPPTLAEPPQASVLAAIVAFPEIVANGSYAGGGIGMWSYALPTSEKGRYGTLVIMAHHLCTEGHTPTAAAWAVYWLAKHGLIVQTGETVAVEQTSSTNTRPMPPGRMMIDVAIVAQKYGCDERSVFRWADAGKIPFGVKLGSLRRWDISEIDAHIAGGCKPVRTGDESCQPQPLVP